MSIVSSVVICVNPATSYAADLSYNSFSSDKLLEIGHKYSDDNENIEQAIMALTMLTKRYSMKSARNDKINIIKAYDILWTIYFFNYFDCNKASEYLKEALKISDEIGYDKGRIYLSMGIMNHSIYAAEASSELLPEAKKYYSLAFDTAFRNEDISTAVISLINLVVISNEMNELDTMNSYFGKMNLFWKSEGAARISENIVSNYKYARDLFFSLKAMSENRFEECIGTLNALADNYSRYTPRYDSSNMRVLANILLTRSDAYLKFGDIKSGIADLKQVGLISQQSNLYDEWLSSLHKLIDCYKLAGENDSMLDAKVRYLSLKDSVMNFRQIASVNELKVMNKMQEIDKEMSLIKQRNLIYCNIIIATLFVAICIGYVLYVVRKKKRLIEDAYRQLYRKNEELLVAEEKYVRQIGMMKAALEHPIQETYTPDSDSFCPGAEGNGKNENNSESAPFVKYKNSCLDESRKDALMLKIEDALSNEDTVCSTDFSSAQLSSLIDVPYKYLSQVINERYGGNFNSMVNSIRIKTACRLMKTTEGQMMTVEGIANKVGFKSRSAFGRVFKSITGLSPSDYLKMAKTEMDERRQYPG